MLCDTIRELRKQRGLSQTQVAMKLGITQGAVSQWELGLTEPGADQLLSLAEIFGVSVYELKGRDEPEKKEAPPVKDGADGDIDVMIQQLRQLSPAERKQVLAFAAGILSGHAQ